MKYRLLTGLAVVPLILVVLCAGPANAASLGGFAAEAGGPGRQGADSVGTLAGGLVVAASAAFAGTAMVRRRKG